MRYGISLSVLVVSFVGGAGGPHAQVEKRNKRSLPFCSDGRQVVNSANGEVVRWYHSVKPIDPARRFDKRGRYALGRLGAWTHVVDLKQGKEVCEGFHDGRLVAKNTVLATSGNSVVKVIDLNKKTTEMYDDYVKRTGQHFEQHLERHGPGTIEMPGSKVEVGGDDAQLLGALGTLLAKKGAGPVSIYTGKVVKLRPLPADTRDKLQP